MAPSEPAVPGELTIDQLSAKTHLPSRTIRFYQSRGALMGPEIRGRVAYYSAAHVERLKLIAQLQDRGLRIDAIADLVGSIDRGEVDLAEWLGVEQQVQASWSNDQPKTVSEPELLEITGAPRPGLISELVRGGLLQRKGDVYQIESPALLSLALKLSGAGVDLETVRLASAILHKHARRAVKELIALFLGRARDGGLRLGDAASVLQTLRPTGLEAVRVIFGRSMEVGLRELMESGQLASIPGKGARPKRHR